MGSSSAVGINRWKSWSGSCVHWSWQRLSFFRQHLYALVIVLINARKQCKQMSVHRICVWILSWAFGPMVINYSEYSYLPTNLFLCIETLIYLNIEFCCLLHIFDMNVKPRYLVECHHQFLEEGRWSPGSICSKPWGFIKFLLTTFFFTNRLVALNISKSNNLGMPFGDKEGSFRKYALTKVKVFVPIGFITWKW